MAATSRRGFFGFLSRAAVASSVVAHAAPQPKPVTFTYEIKTLDSPDFEALIIKALRENSFGFRTRFKAAIDEGEGRGLVK